MGVVYRWTQAVPMQDDFLWTHWKFSVTTCHVVIYESLKISFQRFDRRCFWQTNSQMSWFCLVRILGGASTRYHDPNCYRLSPNTNEYPLSSDVWKEFQICWFPCDSLKIRINFHHAGLLRCHCSYQCMRLMDFVCTRAYSGGFKWKNNKLTSEISDANGVLTAHVNW